MRLILIIYLFVLGLCVQAQDYKNFSIELPDSIKSKRVYSYQPVSTDFLLPGEELSFKLTFGWFTVGKSIVKTDTRFHEINNRECYRIRIDGWTTGMVDWLAKVDDQWTTYLDKSSLVTHYASRKIKEGNYRKNEITKFDQETDMIEVTEMRLKTGKYVNAQYYKAQNDMRDMIGGFYYLRSVDYSNMSVGQTVEVKGFLEDTFYDMKVKYLGKEKVKTKMGTIYAIKIQPIMPENSLFDGKDSITAWLSDDRNKIPVKVEAEFFIGDAGIEITDAKNLRHKLNIKD